jgi:F420H2:quinone oxidoreductase subunit B/C
MSEDQVRALAAELGATVGTNIKSIELIVPPDKVPIACQRVAAIPGLYHLSTMTGFDKGDSIEILYHFWQGKRFVDVRTSVPKTAPRMKSISGEIAAATLYEAEIQDILGVTFDGNPYQGKRLLLPDNYPADAPPPLTKEANPEKIRKMLELE